MASMTHLLSDHLDKVSLFLKVVESGSFRAAAREGRLTQPALSRAVRILEECLGGSLFERSVNGVTCTVRGEALHSFALQLKGRVQELENDLLPFGKPLRGRIRVGTYESLAVYLWPKILASFRETAPELDFVLRTGRSHAMMRLLLNSDVDLAVTVNPQKESAVTQVVLYEDEFSLFRSPALKETGKTAVICLTDHWNEKSQGRRKTPFQRFASQRARVEVDSLEAVKNLAVQGVGYAALPLRVAQDAVHRSLLREGTGEGIPPIRWGRHQVALSYSSSLEPRGDLQHIVSRILALARRTL